MSLFPSEPAGGVTCLQAPGPNAQRCLLLLKCHVHVCVSEARAGRRPVRRTHRTPGSATWAQEQSLRAAALGASPKGTSSRSHRRPWQQPRPARPAPCSDSCGPRRGGTLGHDHPSVSRQTAGTSRQTAGTACEGAERTRCLQPGGTRGCKRATRARVGTPWTGTSPQSGAELSGDKDGRGRGGAVGDLGLKCRGNGTQTGNKSQVRKETEKPAPLRPTTAKPSGSVLWSEVSVWLIPGGSYFPVSHSYRGPRGNRAHGGATA